MRGCVSPWWVPPIPSLGGKKSATWWVGVDAMIPMILGDLFPSCWDLLLSIFHHYPSLIGLKSMIIHHWQSHLYCGILKPFMVAMINSIFKPLSIIISISQYRPWFISTTPVIVRHSLPWPQEFSDWTADELKAMRGLRIGQWEGAVFFFLPW